MSTENDKVKKIKKKKIRHSDRFPIIALRKSSRISNLVSMVNSNKYLFTLHKAMCNCSYIFQALGECF